MLEVPIVEPGGNVASDSSARHTSASNGVARTGTQAISRPSTAAVGMSFRLCTPTSTRPSTSASSSTASAREATAPASAFTRAVQASLERDLERVPGPPRGYDHNFVVRGEPFALRGPVLHGDERGRTIGFVPQEAFLFSRSLRDNVRLADEEAADERIEAAAETAGLRDDVQGFPRRWDTVVGERGLTLSGGQRQRVALARALLNDPPYLVLDDVLASVDAGKEWEILRALRGAARGRTTLVITHRLRAAQDADWVVVLDEGRVVEAGPHAALLAAGGLYARLWRVQQIEDELVSA